jgi:hypothetical protein
MKHSRRLNLCLVLSRWPRFELLTLVELKYIQGLGNLGVFRGMDLFQGSPWYVEFEFLTKGRGTEGS